MTIKEILKGRKTRDFITTHLGFVPDALYISLFYFAATGKWPDLKNPKGFNEKLNWLKLHEDYSQYTDYCDKIKVRKIIREKLGEGYTFPLLGQWKRFEEIDFSKLPDAFVLKCNHDSGSTKIIHDKSALTDEDWLKLKKFYNRRVKEDAFIAGREPCYKGIDRYIIAEPVMKGEDDDASGIKDYKFFCFDGEPKLLLRVSGRQAEKHEDYFDMDGHWIPEIHTYHTPSLKCPDLPDSFEIMKKMAMSLSKDIKQVRMDFYEIDGKPYFGEFTFFSGGGFEMFYPEEWERQLGDWTEMLNQETSGGGVLLKDTIL